jgi:tetratricopeptide (TPR) repeat protein
LPDFEFPLRSPSSFPPSPCETTFSNSSKGPDDATGSGGSFDDQNSGFDLDSPSPRLSNVPDDSFWATSAALLGPDFAFNSRTLVERVDAARVARDKRYPNTTIVPEPSSPVPGSIIPKELVTSLESLGMSWKWFTEESHVKKYISNRIPTGDPWDFGVCLIHEDGRLQCLVMHAQGPARTYSEPSLFGGLQLDANMLVAGCTPVFWWCRPHPQWSEVNRGRWAKAKKMDTQSAFAKRNIIAFKTLDSPETRFALRQSRQDLLEHVEEREHLTGKYSFATMNTLLQLSTISELLSFLSESERWAAELVKRRTVRVGINNEHTCAARYKHAQLLLKMQRFDEARLVAVQNEDAMRDLPSSDLQVVKQHIQNCAIACKRRKMEDALEVVEHLDVLEKWHPEERTTKEFGLRVLIEVYTHRGQHELVEEYLRKQIDLYDTTYGSKHTLGHLYYSLGSALASQSKHTDAARELRKCTTVYKDVGLESEDVEVIEANVLLGEVLCTLKETSKARQYLEKASSGAILAWGVKDPRALKAQRKLEELDSRSKSRVGLVELLVKHRDRGKVKVKDYDHL